MTELTEEEKETRRAYLRNWRKHNKEKTAEYSRTYWVRKTQKLKAEKEDDK